MTKIMMKKLHKLDRRAKAREHTYGQRSLRAKLRRVLCVIRHRGHKWSNWDQLSEGLSTHSRSCYYHCGAVQWENSQWISHTEQEQEEPPSETLA